MVRRLLLLVVPLLLLTSVAAVAGGEGWMRRRVADHPVTVEVPAPTQHEHDTSDWVLGRAETDSLRAEVEGARLSISVTVAPLTALRIAGSGLVFTTTRSTLLGHVDGRMTSWTDIQRAGLTGKRLTYVTEQDGAPQRGLMEVFVKDQYILTLDARLGPSVAPEVAERFLGSLRLTEAP